MRDSDIEVKVLKGEIQQLNVVALLIVAISVQWRHWREGGCDDHRTRAGNLSASLVFVHS